MVREKIYKDTTTYDTVCTYVHSNSHTTCVVRDYTAIIWHELTSAIFWS